MAENKWKIIPENELEAKIIASPIFIECANFGEQRKGHPEGDLGTHIKQILDYINTQNWNVYRTDLRILGFLHDLGKIRVKISKNGHVIGKSHSEHSVEIAKEFTTEEKLLNIIAVHDKYFNFYQDYLKGKFKPEKFLRIYAPLNLELLTRFNYADSNNREKDSVKWFEDTCKSLGIKSSCLYENEPGV